MTLVYGIPPIIGAAAAKRQLLPDQPLADEMQGVMNATPPVGRSRYSAGDLSILFKNPFTQLS